MSADAAKGDDPPLSCLPCDGPDCAQRAAQQCDRCISVFYCSRSCQKRHWKQEHRNFCYDVRDRRKELKTQLEVNENDENDTKGGKSVDADCAICLGRIQRPILLPECGHVFCTSCLVEWQAYVPYLPIPPQAPPELQLQHKQCPLCRTETSVDVARSILDRVLLIMKRAQGTADGNSVADLWNQALDELELDSDAILAQNGQCHWDWHGRKVKILLHLKRWADAIESINVALSDVEEGRNQPSSMAERRVKDAYQLAEETDLGKPLPLVATDFEAELHLDKAEAYLGLEEWEKALEASQSAIEYTLMENISNKVLLQVFVMTARCLYHSGLYDEAIQKVDATLTIDRHFPQTYRYKILALQKLGRMNEAVQTASEAVLYEAPWDRDNKKLVREQYREVLHIKKEVPR